MRISVPLTNGFLPDEYGQYAQAADRRENYPVRSFPISITDAPAGTKTFALSLVDFDSVPVCGFVWIHWTAANIPASLTDIPDDASRKLADQFVQGHNSNVSRFTGMANSTVARGYVGPQPPDKTHDYTLTVYAVDEQLPLQNDYYLNALRHALVGHVLAKASVELPYRK